ncbi:hypothetical protein D3C81_1878310 [compost metagenome]
MHAPLSFVQVQLGLVECLAVGRDLRQQQIGAEHVWRTAIADLHQALVHPLFGFAQASLLH